MKYKNVVLTGAAAGIGRQMALELRNAGCSLYLLDVDAKGLAELKKQLLADRQTADVQIFTVDIAKKDEVERFKKRMGAARIDMLINNAGIARVGRFEEMAFEEFEKILSVNLMGLARMTHALLPNIINSPNGHIVNIASAAGFAASAGLAAYTASKFGVVGFSRSIQMELHGRVDVTIVCPTFVQTNIVKSIHRNKISSREDENRFATMEHFLSRAGSDVEKAVRSIMRGIKKRKKFVLVNPSAHAVYFGQRFAPRIAALVARIGYERVYERKLKKISRNLETRQTSDYFSRIQQHDIKIRRYRGKSPMFYREAKMMAGIFTVDAMEAKKLMPTDRHRPLEIFPGRALAAIHCFEYDDSDVGPYNEVSLSIGLNFDGRFGTDTISMIKSALTKSFSAHIVDLPVTTQIALYGGLDYFNYPKYIANIVYEETEASRICRVLNSKNGKTLLEITGRKISGNGKYAMNFHSYPAQKQNILHALFKLRTSGSGKSVLRNDMKIVTGDDPGSDIYRRLKFGKQLEYLYAPSVEGILYMPHPV